MSAIFENGNNGFGFNFTSVLLDLGLAGLAQVMDNLNGLFTLLKITESITKKQNPLKIH